jgi:hypothetical protein
MMTEVGPVQLVAIAFGPGADYQGRVLGELESLEGRGLIRVLDLLFVAYDTPSGELTALNYQGDDLGGLVGALLGFAFGGSGSARALVRPEGEHPSGGMTRHDLEDLVARAQPDEAIAVLLLEHVWARNFKRAMIEAGGIPLGEGFLSDDALEEIAAELEETVKVLDDLEREEASVPVPAG